VATQVHDQTSQLGDVLRLFVTWAKKRHGTLATLSNMLCKPVSTFFKEYIDIINDLDDALIAAAKANEGVLELIENSKQTSLVELDVESSTKILALANGECSAEQHALLAYATSVDQHILNISQQCNGYLAQWSGLSKCATVGERAFSDVMNRRVQPECKEE